MENRAPLKIGFRRLFASGQSPTGKIFGGYLQAATLKSSCIGLFAHSLKIHPIEFFEIPCKALFRQVRIGKLELKNRFMIAMTSGCAIGFADEAEDAISGGVCPGTQKRGA
ncbi:MAG: hypothetical protein PUC15_06285 [Lentisphaeria bacterium]|nr:hypothetical protein [Lentisphaeria bacterium]